MLAFTGCGAVARPASGTVLLVVVQAEAHQQRVQPQFGFERADDRDGRLRRRRTVDTAGTGDLVLVDDFLNHRVDPIIIDEIGRQLEAEVARTIADLEGASSILKDHVMEAVQYRALERQ